MDGGAWWATVHRVAKSRTRLSDFTSKNPLRPPLTIFHPQAPNSAGYKSPALFADLFVSPVRSVSVCLARSELRVGGLTGDDWSLGAEPRVSRSVCLTCNPPRLKGHSAALILPYPLSQSCVCILHIFPVF